MAIRVIKPGRCGVVVAAVLVPLLCLASLAAWLACGNRFGQHRAGPVDRRIADRQWTNSIGVSFVPIPSGTFAMGSRSSDAEGHERPVHPVTISRAFALATTEVTQCQWRAMTGSNPSHFQGDDLPVEQVSWDEVKHFINALNAKEGTSRYRLPSEAEWEYACRAGGAEHELEGLDSVAWYAVNSGGTTHRVAEKARNPLGLHDMLGNVYEWCEDWKGPYQGAGVIDPRGPATGWGRVVRGGSWLVHANRAHCEFRDHLAPDERRSDVGFRLAAD